MRKILASLFNRLSGGESLEAPPKPVIPEEEEDAVAFESLAMTDELREALFPKTTQMVSAIFDRAAPPPSAPPPSPSRSGLPL
jgi:hypothetical protein